ncbi:methyltransferase domain-containing protein [Cytobacillus sp. FSL K6-0265]|uniref:methyltransferase domain-containing protein n=1 Tax=Cytobacillus sp. FSL K6-0265 TaxID=2921448 RepID=UPI0030FA2AF1
MKNPTLSTYWLFPHSPEWYRQISKNGEAYKYPWQSTIDSPIAENIFDQLVCLHTKDKVTLDFGCGDGRFTKKYALYAKQMIGADSSIQFIHTATKTKPDNTTFIIAHSKNELPFKPAFFDLAITRKGPTSIYQQLPHYVKEGGLILGLHPGENEGKELSTWFPHLFPDNQHTIPIEQHLTEIFTKTNFKKFKIHPFHTIEYLHTPLDLIHYRCFGQKKEIYQIVNSDLREITNIFKKHQTAKGLPLTYERYITIVHV